MVVFDRLHCVVNGLRVLCIVRVLFGCHVVFCRFTLMKRMLHAVLMVHCCFRFVSHCIRLGRVMQNAVFMRFCEALVMFAVVLGAAVVVSFC